MKVYRHKNGGVPNPPFFFLFQAIEKRHRLSRCVTPKRQDFHYRFPREYDADMFSDVV